MVQCFQCEKTLTTPWGIYVHSKSRYHGLRLLMYGPRILWGVYCSKACAESDIAGPVFNGCRVRKTTMKSMEKWLKEEK